MIFDLRVDIAELRVPIRMLIAFQNLYSAAARPFNWKYTASDLNDLLDRIAAHEQHTPLAAAA